MTGRDLVEAHVRAFNHGVRHGDWEPMLRRFADHASVRFEGVPVGPYEGLDAIRRAYREAPPDDEIRLLGIQDEDKDEGRVVTAAFAWARGGTGRMVLELDAGLIRTLTIAFDP